MHFTSFCPCFFGGTLHRAAFFGMKFHQEVTYREARKNQENARDHGHAPLSGHDFGSQPRADLVRCHPARYVRLYINRLSYSGTAGGGHAVEMSDMEVYGIPHTDD